MYLQLRNTTNMSPGSCHETMISLFIDTLDKQWMRDCMRSESKPVWDMYLQWEREDVFGKLADLDDDRAFGARMTYIMGRGPDVTQRFVEWAVENEMMLLES